MFSQPVLSQPELHCRTTTRPAGADHDGPGVRTSADHEAVTVLPAAADKQRRPRRGEGGAVTPGMVARDDLVARLDHAATRKVTIISAPAGSGKTSLLH